METISFIASDGDRVLWDRLSQLFQSASVLRIASAFLGAHDEVFSWVNRDSERRVEILVRLAYPTDPASVAAFLNHPQVAIRAADTANMPFHEKLFLALDSSDKCLGAYVGSANWTQGGLRRNREAGVWVSEQTVLRQMANHFSAEFHAAARISDRMMAELRLDVRRQRTHGTGPRKDRGTLISSWRELKAATDGRFVIKQNGVSWRPFVEGRDEWIDFVQFHNHSSQTFSRIPSTFEPGLGCVVSRIARRQDGSPDRLVYGRGRVAAFDRKRWRLPDQYLAALSQRGLLAEKIEYLKRWPEILWLDPVEFIDYPRGTTDFLWLSSYMEPSFQGGFRWITEDVWDALNQSLDTYTEKYRVLAPDREGIWWNDHLGMDDRDDPLYMTKARIEEMNCGS
jgi:hypothetical protein